MNDYGVGVKKAWLHLVGFGVTFGLLTYYGGWGSAVVLAAWRFWAEREDVMSGRDTLGKALIDFSSQVATPVAVALVRVLR